ncbi:ACT domain-containing protein [Veillonella caviae]|uniref:ACT domain-containing protein n=1 Tax=Veillonella caviae TaxID=248316 RepID=UPI000F8C6288|nr:ACT domain-containing protein [Veillonella caviae]MCF0157542.1 ACT domain-containing protein [Veillonella sp.]MCI5708211.1 ACT domain-containing protein [Veillonella caviae]MCI7694394.1 ACT domain-containing protein [Veillonella caviae]MDD7290968.1 ACT domain-containing protein [Veillonella caviae]MDY5254736.1 ACT domain-containing protein [Veillonella caviae]
MKLVVTVVGVDRVGIIAGVSTILANHKVNILSINQTILDGLFNMIMMCETESEDVKDLTSIQESLVALGSELGVEIRAQHADIFLSMHRVG